VIHIVLLYFKAS